MLRDGAICIACGSELDGRSAHWYARCGACLASDRPPLLFLARRVRSARRCEGPGPDHDASGSMAA